MARNYNFKLTFTFLFLDSSSSFPFPTGIVEVELRKSRGKEIYNEHLILFVSVEITKYKKEKKKKL
ncbi:hypothetical protein BpHYR1_041102 [Brachionus plicatilis]|uniref:Uncharacterized protein n=1 Tax=Brachionus plicatilis TaxID=10195 RepID=A0A3M7S3I4_BRAPC|nr:hypothetical protein BpHYR1_041102 [Brachionus plicatilis]